MSDSKKIVLNIQQSINGSEVILKASQPNTIVVLENQYDNVNQSEQYVIQNNVNDVNMKIFEKPHKSIKINTFDVTKSNQDSTIQKTQFDDEYVKSKEVSFFDENLIINGVDVKEGEEVEIIQGDDVQFFINGVGELIVKCPDNYDFQINENGELIVHVD